MIAKVAGANRVATLPKFFPAIGWFSQDRIVSDS